jgi:hypothetical protein
MSKFYFDGTYFRFLGKRVSIHLSLNKPIFFRLYKRDGFDYYTVKKIIDWSIK